MLKIALKKLLGFSNDYYANQIGEFDIGEAPIFVGAFMIMKKSVFEHVKGFDEDYFMYGEDIDLSYRIKQVGFRIIYEPQYRVIHLKYASGLEKRDVKTRNKTKWYFYDAMRIFYKKHYQKLYPNFINSVIYFFIEMKKKAYV